MHRLWLRALCGSLVGCLLCLPAATGADADAARLVEGLKPFLAIASGDRDRFTLTATIDVLNQSLLKSKQSQRPRNADASAESP